MNSRPTKNLPGQDPSQDDASPTRTRSSKISRERILEAALVEFAESGYEGATTASVARRVGVTQPLIHYHFGSKEALWRAAVDLAFARMQTVLQGVEEDIQAAPPEEAVPTMARRFVYFNAKHPEVGRLMITESAVRTQRLEWMIERHIRPLFDQVGMLIQAAKDTGLVKDLPIANVLLMFLGAAPHFFDSAPLVEIIYGLDSRSEEQIERHAETVVEIFSHGIMNDRRPVKD